MTARFSSNQRNTRGHRPRLQKTDIWYRIRGSGEHMPYKIILLMLSFAVAASGQGRGAPEPPRPDNPQSLAHIDAAKKIAGTDPFLLNPYNFYCVAGNARAQNNNAPDLEPIKLFDNVYAVGNSETAVYALSSSEGLVLLDAGFENKAEALVAQLQKLGFSPDKVKYILLAHGHADHFGGAKYFQDHFGTKVGTTAADWDLIAQTPNR